MSGRSSKDMQVACCHLPQLEALTSEATRNGRNWVCQMPGMAMRWIYTRLTRSTSRWICSIWRLKCLGEACQRDRTARPTFEFDCAYSVKQQDSGPGKRSVWCMNSKCPEIDSGVCEKCFSSSAKTAGYPPGNGSTRTYKRTLIFSPPQSNNVREHMRAFGSTGTKGSTARTLTFRSTPSDARIVRSKYTSVLPCLA